MPYIDKNLREGLDSTELTPHSEGELNYQITKLCHDYIKRFKTRYTILNEVIGVLECAKLEIYRMIVAEYENKKRLENGAISDLDAVNLEDVR